MTSTYWPLRALRIRTDRLELRLPDLADLDQLATLAAEGVHDPKAMPFVVPWTDAEPATRALSTLQYHWRTWANWQQSNWELALVVLADGVLVGTQELSARDFAIVREVHTGSWLGRQHHGRGIGTEMRSAVLALAFDGLGARSATSSAFTDNPASLAVSSKLGYQDDGLKFRARRGQPAVTKRLRLDRAGWEQRRPTGVTIEGLEPCLPMFGV